MRTWSFYDTTTGLFSARHFRATEARALAVNTPEGCRAMEGAFDCLAQRVDLETGEVVDYQPPQPSSTDHEWDATSKRWKLTAAVTARRERAEQAKGRIEQLERSQLRTMREALLGDSAARDRLAATDAEIAKLRERL